MGRKYFHFLCLKPAALWFHSINCRKKWLGKVGFCGNSLFPLTWSYPLYLSSEEHTVFPGKITTLCLFSSEMKVRFIPADAGYLSSSLFSLWGFFTAGWLYPAVRLSQKICLSSPAQQFLPCRCWVGSSSRGWLPAPSAQGFYGIFTIHFLSMLLHWEHCAFLKACETWYAQVLHLHSIKTIIAFAKHLLVIRNVNFILNRTEVISKVYISAGKEFHLLIFWSPVAFLWSSVEKLGDWNSVVTSIHLLFPNWALNQRKMRMFQFTSHSLNKQGC